MPRILRAALVVAGLALAGAVFSASRHGHADVTPFAAAPGSDDLIIPVSSRQRLPLAAYIHPTLSALFGTPVVAPVVEVKPPVVAKVEAPPAPAPPPDPLAGYVYSGLVTIDGQTYALLESRATRSGKYLAVGDDFEGFRVSAVDGKSITLSRGEEPRVLALNDRYSLIPLSKDGQGLPNRTAQPVSAQPESKVATYDKVVTFQLASSYAFVGSENIDKLHDDYYNGKISLDELNQRANNGPGSILLGATVRLIDADTSNLYWGMKR